MAQINNVPGAGVGTADVMIPESWYKDVQFARDDNFVAAGLVERKYESDLKVGDTVNMPFIADLTTETITSGSDLTPVANTETEVTLLVDQFKGVAVEIFDQTKWQSKYDLDKAYSNRIGQALAADVDTAILSEAQNLAGVYDPVAVAAVTYDDIVDRVSVLDAANVPQSDRFMIVNAVTLGDLRKDAQFVRYDATGSKHASTQGGGVGAIGEIYGIKVYLSNNVQTDTSYVNVIAHKSWMALAIQKKPDMEMHRNPLGSATYLIGRVLYGLKEVRADHAVTLRRTV